MTNTNNHDNHYHLHNVVVVVGHHFVCDFVVHFEVEKIVVLLRLHEGEGTT